MGGPNPNPNPNPYSYSYLETLGGGPFGPGRLGTKELPNLEESLVSLLDVLREDVTYDGSQSSEDLEHERMLARRQEGEGFDPDSETEEDSGDIHDLDSW